MLLNANQGENDQRLIWKMFQIVSFLIQKKEVYKICIVDSGSSNALRNFS